MHADITSSVKVWFNVLEEFEESYKIGGGDVLATALTEHTLKLLLPIMQELFSLTKLEDCSFLDIEFSCIYERHAKSHR